MANFGIEATQMSQPSLAGASHISEGVVDKSKALDISASGNLLLNAAKMGKEAYDGYQIAKEGNTIIDLIQEKNERDNPNTIFAEPDKNKSLPVLSYEQKLDRYNKALKQGRMREGEFTTNVKNILRQAVNNNPALAQEFYNKTNQILNLSGITESYKAEAEVAKSLKEEEEAKKKFILDVAKSVNTPLLYTPEGTIDYTAMSRLNTSAQEEQFILKSMEGKTKFTVEEFRQYGTQAAIALVNKASDLAIKIAKDPSIPVDAALFQITNIFSSVERDFISDPRVGTIIDQAPVKDTVDFIRRQVEVHNKNITSFKNKDELAKYLQNITQMTRNKQSLEVMRNLNVEGLDAVSRLSTAIGLPTIITKHPELATSLMNTLSNLVGGISTKGTNAFLPIPGEKQSLGEKVLDSSANIATNEGDDGVILTNVLSAMNEDLNAISIPEKFNIYSKYVKILGNEKYREGVNKLEMGTRQQTLSNVSDYVAVTFDGMSTFIKEQSDRGVNINIDLLSDGKLSVLTDDPKITKEINGRFVFRINDGLAAFASLKGYSSSKEAAKEYYTQYREYLGIEDAPFPPSSPPKETPVAQQSSPVAQQSSPPTKKYTKPEYENIYEDASLAGMALVAGELVGMDEQVMANYKWLGKKIASGISKTDDIIFGAWREAVTQGLMSELEYRKGVRRKLGIEK